MFDKTRVKKDNANNGYKFSVLDMQGLFCGVLSRLLENGTLTKQFVEDMQKRGVLTDSKQIRMVEQQINFMIHGDRDFFAFNSSLLHKENAMSTREKLRQKLIEEETIKRLSADSDAPEYTTKKGILCMNCSGGNCAECITKEETD